MPCRLIAARPRRATSRVEAMPTRKVATTTTPKLATRPGSNTAPTGGARQGAEEQHRQGEGADEGVEGGRGLAAQDTEPAGEIAGGDHAEDRESDVQDGLQRSQPLYRYINKLT